MLSLSDCLRAKEPGAICSGCAESGCRIGIRSGVLVLKGELLRQTGKAADCVVVVSERPAVIAVVELKSRAADAKAIQEKLENTCSDAFRLAKSCGCMDLKIFPIVVAKSWRSSQHQVLKSRKIRINGRLTPVAFGRCGEALAAVFARYGFDTAR